MGTASADPTAQDWANIRNCESGGNYSINTGNGYYGAYQFDLGTWRSVGGSGYPNDASPATQDALALALWRSRGWSPWACASLVSLSDGKSAPIATKPTVKPTPYAKMSSTSANKWASHAFTTILGRSGGTAYAAQLKAGMTNKSIVANKLAKSAENRQQVVAHVYQQCLGRQPDASGLKARAAQLAASNLTAVYTALCASKEATNRVHGNTATWVDYLYRGMLGRHATAAEKRAVVAYVNLHGKAAAVKTVLAKSEWRNREVNFVYSAMLGRHADSAGLRTYAAQMPGKGYATLPVALALSSEFANKA